MCNDAYIVDESFTELEASLASQQGEHEWLYEMEVINKQKGINYETDSFSLS